MEIEVHKKKKKKRDIKENEAILEHSSASDDQKKKHKKKHKSKEKVREKLTESEECQPELTNKERTKKKKHKHLTHEGLSEVHAKKHKQHENVDELESSEDANKKTDQVGGHQTEEHRKTKKRKHLPPEVDTGRGDEIIEENESESALQIDSSTETKKKKHKKKKKKPLEEDESVTRTENPSGSKPVTEVDESDRKALADFDETFDSDDQSLFLTQTPAYVAALERSVRLTRSVSKKVQFGTEADVDSATNSSKSKKKKSKTKKSDASAQDKAVSNPKAKKASKVTSNAKANKQTIDHREGDEVFVADQLLTMIKDLKLSEIPQTLDFEPPLLHTKNSPMLLKKAEKEALLAQGAEIKTSAWSKKEDTILQRNMLEFTEKEGIPHPALLLGFVPELHRKLFKYFAATNFYILLGKDLDNRLLHSVYKRARRIFSPYPKFEKLTQEDMEQILHMQAKKGNKWAEFASIVNRDPSAIESAVRWHGSQKTLGKWTEDEDKRLRKAVKRYNKKLGLKSNNANGLPWEKIAKKVGARNHTQCYHRWVFTLSLPSRTPNFKWNRKNDACLIYLMYKSDCEEEQAVDWNEIAEKMDKTLFNDFILKSRWRILKYTVPNYKDQEFEDIVLYLYHHQLPSILKRLKWTMEELEQACES